MGKLIQKSEAHTVLMMQAGQTFFYKVWCVVGGDPYAEALKEYFVENGYEEFPTSYGELMRFSRGEDIIQVLTVKGHPEIVWP